MNSLVPGLPICLITGLAGCLATRAAIFRTRQITTYFASTPHRIIFQRTCVSEIKERNRTSSAAIP